MSDMLTWLRDTAIHISCDEGKMSVVSCFALSFISLCHKSHALRQIFWSFRRFV